MKRTHKKFLSLAMVAAMMVNGTAYASSEIGDNDPMDIVPIEETKEVAPIEPANEIQDVKEVETSKPEEKIVPDDIFTGSTIEDSITGGDFDYNSSTLNNDSFRFDDPIVPVKNTPVYNSEPFDFFQVDNGNNNTFNYLGEDSSMEIGEPEKDKEPGDNFLETKRTVQYTKDLDDDYPIYIDTGIEVSEEGEISMNGLKEIFRQLAIKEHGKIIEDSEKTMLLINGSIILAEEDITKLEDIENIFLDSNIKLVGQSSRIGGRFDLVEKLERSKELPVIIDESELKLSAKPMIYENKVLLPVRDISEGLGAEIEWDKEKGEAKITKEDKTIILRKNSDIITINGKEFLVSSPTKIRAGENRILSIVRILVTEFNGEMFYDAHKQALVIETPEIVNVDSDW